MSLFQRAASVFTLDTGTKDHLGKSSNVTEKAIKVLILVRTRYSGLRMNERYVLSILFVVAGLLAFAFLVYWLWAGK